MASAHPVTTALAGRSSRLGPWLGASAWALLLAFFSLRVWQYWPGNAEVTVDSRYYLDEPISLLGHGNRSVLGGLFFQAFRAHLLGAAITQHLAACLAWLFTAGVCMVTLGRLVGLAVFALSFSRAVAGWEDNVLLEATVLSGLVAYVGLLALGLARPHLAGSRTWAVTGTLVVVAVHLLKPSYFPVWALLLALLVVLTWRRRPARAWPGVLVAVGLVVSGAVFVRHQALGLRGWQAQTRSFSLQRHPEYRELEAKAGAPPCAPFDAAAQAPDQNEGWAEAWGSLPSTCPERRAWYDAGGMAPARLARTPLSTLRMAVRDAHLWLISPRDYFESYPANALSELADALLGTPSMRARLYPDLRARTSERRGVAAGLGALLAAGAALAILRAWASRRLGARLRPHAEPALALAALAAALLAGIAFSWAADGMDLERHALVMNVPLKLALLLAPALSLRPTRRGPVEEDV